MRNINLRSKFSKRIAILFLLGFAGGILLINLLGKSYLNQAGILSDYFLKQYKYLEIDSIQLFFYILEKRMKWVAVLWILGYTAIGIIAGGGYTLWFGFSAGTLLSISVLKLGVKGMLFCVGAMFPQILIYVPAWVFFLYAINSKAEKRNFDWGYTLAGIGMCLITLFGIFVESYMNPWVVKQILRIF